MGAHEPVILAKNKDLVLNSMKEEEEEETDTKAEKVVTEKAGDSAHFWRSLVGTLPDVESRTPTSPTLEQSACLEEKHDSEKYELPRRHLQRSNRCHRFRASNLHPKMWAFTFDSFFTHSINPIPDFRPRNLKPRVNPNATTRGPNIQNPDPQLLDCEMGLR
uniref:Uncharacterized protein n=1 Tax=Moniliophthora roreri TaxID=221103 RepID=A0A0W0FYP1_MONRR